MKQRKLTRYHKSYAQGYLKWLLVAYGQLDRSNRQDDFFALASEDAYTEKYKLSYERLYYLYRFEQCDLNGFEVNTRKIGDLLSRGFNHA